MVDGIGQIGIGQIAPIYRRSQDAMMQDDSNYQANCLADQRMCSEYALVNRVVHLRMAGQSGRIRVLLPVLRRFANRFLVILLSFVLFIGKTAWFANFSSSVSNVMAD